ncbi:MAG: phage terminase large subunit family protein [Gammaproteobacteria bacterium]|nr:MAG: phage terminase large subunit family protein [Gammaproteobacteria bacterium]
MKIMRAWAPPPKMTISEWADSERRLSPESSAEPGRWDTSNAEYQRGIMDAISDDNNERVVVMSSAQVGKTEIVNNAVGYFIHREPAPILVLQPTIDMAQTWSKDRLAPMLRDTPVLRDKVKPARTKDSDNTILHKVFKGGHITVAGANSPASLASRPIRVVLADEVDRYPFSAGAEGDPLSLAIKRATTFWNRKIVVISTPTVKDVSRIEKEWKLSDQRRFFVPCPDCGHYQYLKWSNVSWMKDDQGEHYPETAVYACEECGSAWDDIAKMEAIQKGEWRPTRESDVPGFHIWEAYSPWSSLKRIVADFLKKKDDPELLKTFVNTVLGETWEEKAEERDPNSLLRRREKYDAPVPEGALFLTAAVDVQDDRFEVEVKGWGRGQENWGIEYYAIFGNPENEKMWIELDQKLQKEYRHKSGVKMSIACTTIDSGGHFADQVYRFCRGKQARRIFAIKGHNQPGRPIVTKPSRNNRYNIPLWLVGTDTAKERLFTRLGIEDPGPGFMHFPETYEPEYFEQLTAEKVITRMQRGYARRVWIKTRPRNEALDLNVYNFAAVEILNPDYDALEKALDMKTKKDKKPARGKKRPRGWVNAWKM